MQARFTCNYCKKVMVREHAYLQHECKQKKREDEFKSVAGQAAMHYYQLWMRAQNRMPPPPQSFLTSKYFRTFINFNSFVKRVSMPKPEKFIWLMVQKKFSPVMWCSDDAYTLYVEFLDRKTSPLDQAKLSIETLLRIATHAEIDIQEVFTKIQPPDIIHMLRTRQLSPWLLLFSKKFKELFANKTTPEQKIIIENLVRPEYWHDKFEEHAEAVTTIKMLVSEMGI